MQSHKQNVHLLHLGIFIYSFSIKTRITIQLYQRNNRDSPQELCLPKSGKIQLPKRGKYWILSRNQSKLTLRKARKQRIDEIYIWLDLDDEDTKKLLKETSSDNKNIQEQVIPAFDIHNKEFGSGTGNERIAADVYELGTSHANAAILKSIQ